MSRQTSWVEDDGDEIMDEVDEQEKADLDLYPSDFDESDNDEYGFEEFESEDEGSESAVAAQVGHGREEPLDVAGLRAREMSAVGRASPLAHAATLQCMPSNSLPCMTPPIGSALEALQPAVPFPQQVASPFIPKPRTSTSVDSPLLSHSAARRSAYSRKSRSLGQSTIADWKKGEMIGSGSFGDVYKALNMEDGSIMAVKEVCFSGDDEKQMAVVRREINLMRSLRHRHIVSYLGTEIDVKERKLHIFQEWVAGGSVKSILDQYGPLSENVVMKYTLQVLHGLKFLHENQIVHRDIKGSNLLVDDRGTIKLADFGTSRRVSDTTMRNDDENFKTMCGTPYFIAPEVALESGHGSKADIWSLGGAVLQMLTAQPPWKSLDIKSPIYLLQIIAVGTQLPPFPDHLSEDMDMFLRACFTRDSKTRPSAEMLLQHRLFSQTLSPQHAYRGNEDKIARTASMPEAEVPEGSQASAGATDTRLAQDEVFVFDSAGEEEDSDDGFGDTMNRFDEAVEQAGDNTGVVLDGNGFPSYSDSDLSQTKSFTLVSSDFRVFSAAEEDEAGNIGKTTSVHGVVDINPFARGSALTDHTFLSHSERRVTQAWREETGQSNAGDDAGGEDSSEDEFVPAIEDEAAATTAADHDTSVDITRSEFLQSVGFS